MKDLQFTGEDWNALDQIVASQTRQGRYTEYADARSAKKHFLKR